MFVTILLCDNLRYANGEEYSKVLHKTRTATFTRKENNRKGVYCAHLYT